MIAESNKANTVIQKKIKYEVFQNESSLEIRILDKYNPSKIHAFRFYKDRHVTYNQVISGNEFYPNWCRVKKGFGYNSVLKIARVILNSQKYHDVEREGAII